MSEIELVEQKVNSRLWQMDGTQFAARAPIGPWRMQVGERWLEGGIPTPEESWRTIAPGECWVPEADATWFVATAVVPEGWGGGPLIARIDVSGECNAFVDGRLVHSLNHNGHNPGRDEIVLAEQVQPGQRFELALEAARFWPEYHGPHNETFRYAELVIPAEPVRDFLYWARLTLQSAFTWPEGSTQRMRMVRLVDEVLKGIELRKAGTEEYLHQVAEGSRRLQEGLPKIGPGGPGDFTMVGHAHIDTAWLWPLAETKRKCGRTFSNVLSLMERYPDFRFSQSQPQLYKFAKQLYPELWEGLKQRVASGQWEVLGGAWVECDCNLSGGEAMLRQLLYGKRFYRREFGRDTVVGWWPDAFGYSWSMPQILAHCGMKHFFSIKISWNQYNKFPHGLFWWQGIDGSRILAFHGHGTYNGIVEPRELTGLWRDFPHRDRVNDYLHSFGYGDGGGGPTAPMLERARRLTGMPGVPVCRFGRADEFFAKVSTSAEAASAPTWNGELYLELHRGCQTTQARTKRGNRKLELALRELELFGTVALVSGLAPYPSEALQEMWENLLCYQFHDILPGSSVNRVYVEAEEDYARMLHLARELRDGLLEAGIALFDTRGEGQPAVVFNALSWERVDPVEVTVELEGEAFHAVSPSGESTPCQVVCRDGKAVTVVFLARVPALGHTIYHIVPGAVEGAASVCGGEGVVENAALRLEFDTGGRLTRVYDKEAEREVLDPGKAGNLLQLFEDRPITYEAWDIDPWFEDQMWELPEAESAEIVESGPVRATLRFHRRTEQSTLVQDVSFYAHSRRVDFATHVDWHERKTLLKVAFPVDVLTPQATYEIQFGAIQRPTHNNTDWDRAKFEVPAHRWADLSEAGYGVALLNDCKYGYDVKGNVLRLSLLRSSTDPDFDADQGEHDFTYALYPHQGCWQRGEVVRRGLELNVPLFAVPTTAHEGPGPVQGSLASPDRPNVVVETLKKAEDGEDLILRLYEAHGARGPVAVQLSLPATSAVECNGMEEETGPADFQDGVLRLDIKPWQIRSFRLKR